MSASESIDAVNDSAAHQALEGMVWGVKSTFLNYVAQSPGSRQQTGFGSGRTASGEFFFAMSDDSEFDRDSLTGRLRFQGLVQLSAHRGMLRVQLINPWLTVAKTEATLCVLDTSRPLEDDARIDLVRVVLDPPTTDGQTIMWQSADTYIAESASALFNNVYPAGEPFDPMTVRIGATRR
jgi:hypothetical protein